MAWDGWTAGTASEWAGRLWQLLAVVWFVLWFGMKKAKKLEGWGGWAQHGILVILGFWLMFGGLHNWGRLNDRIVPNRPELWVTGLALTALGVGISIWARLSLGSNWSGMVTLKNDHVLVRKGLYRWIRHPIYTGILLGMVGTAMIRGRLGSSIGVGIVLAAFYFKARREERFLREEFGSGFEEHSRHTGMFLPKWT
jgi:protein-S-isoprenylcysteine O-methyltransferase Ste14